MSKAKPHNVQGGNRPRSIRVSDRLWKDADKAAKIADVTRNEFIVSVMKHATHQILSGASATQEVVE